MVLLVEFRAIKIYINNICHKGKGDNCPEIFNADQQDIDGDSIGDECDADIDGDGVENDVDNCPLVYNPSQSKLSPDDEVFSDPK